jgi:hypothetical protein
VAGDGVEAAPENLLDVKSETGVETWMSCLLILHSIMLWLRSSELLPCPNVPSLLGSLDGKEMCARTCEMSCRNFRSVFCVTLEGPRDIVKEKVFQKEQLKFSNFDVHAFGGLTTLADGPGRSFKSFGPQQAPVSARTWDPPEK